MFKTIAIVAVILIVALLVYAATKPDTFRVQRSASIKAPPEKIFPLVNDLHSHAIWSPWEKKDPAMKRTHSGAASGKGAVYEWDGNKEIGKGRMRSWSQPHLPRWCLRCISSSRSRPTTPPSSYWSPGATRRPSPGPSLVLSPNLRRSCISFST
jgi:hypothetical protein